MKPKIAKGDTVEIIAGEHKGYRGEVQRVIRKKEKMAHTIQIGSTCWWRGET